MNFQTGCTLLDLILGGSYEQPGFTSGKIINIVGDKSAGKSFLATEILAYNHHHNHDLALGYCDVENGNSFDLESLYGASFSSCLEHVDLGLDNTIEHFSVSFNKWLDSVKKGGIFVLDSLDLINSKDNQKRMEERIKLADKNKELDKGTFHMGLQKFLSQEFFPNIIPKLQEKDVSLIIISQVRTNIDVFSFEKFTRSGGKALDHSCSIILWLRSLAPIKASGKTGTSIGHLIEAKTSKVRHYRIGRKAIYPLFYRYGIDVIGSNLLYKFNLIESGKINNTKTCIFQNSDSELTTKGLKQFISENDVSENEILEYVSSKGKKNLSVSVLVEFITQHEKLKDVFNNGLSGNYDYLRKCIDNSEDLRHSLEMAVVSQWEEYESDLEKSIGYTRPKFG